MANNDMNGDVIIGSKKNIEWPSLSLFGYRNANNSDARSLSHFSELSTSKTRQSTFAPDILFNHNIFAQGSDTGFTSERDSSVAREINFRVISSEPRVTPACRNPEEDQTTSLDQGNLDNEMKTVNEIESELI